MVRPLKPAPKLSRLTACTLTRAHLALARRPTFGSELAEVVRSVSSMLSDRLGCEVKLTANLQEAAARGASSLGFPGAFALIGLDAVGGFAVAEIAPQLASALVDRLAGGPGEPLAPLPLSEAELAGASLLVLDVLAAMRGSALDKALEPRLVRIVQSSAELCALTDLRAPHLSARIDVACGPATGTVRLLIPASALRFWLESAPVELSQLGPELGALPLGFAVRAGRARLARSELDSVHRGDVVLFDGLTGSTSALAGAARLVGTTFALGGVIGPDGFTLEAFNPNPEPAMSDATQLTRAPELPVEVEIELCRVRVTLAELGGLQAGGVIPLRIAVGEPVTLKVDGIPVAMAELVDIEGEIGARILRLSK